MYRLCVESNCERQERAGSTVTGARSECEEGKCPDCKCVEYECIGRV